MFYSTGFNSNDIGKRKVRIILYCNAQLIFDADLVNNHCAECAKKCIESRVVNKPMAGIKDHEARTKLLKVNEDDFSLENIVTICRTEENSKRNEQKLSLKHVNCLHRKPNEFQRGLSKSRQRKPTQKYRRPKSVERSGTYGSTNQKCPNCAISHPPNKCGSDGRKCNGCSKVGLYFRVCPNNKKGRANLIEDKNTSSVHVAQINKAPTVVVAIHDLQGRKLGKLKPFWIQVPTRVLQIKGFYIALV